MRAAIMNGGLGNQVFQYIFVRYLEERLQTKVFVDDSTFHANMDLIRKEQENQAHPRDRIMHNGYEMDYVFPNMAKLSFLSDFFDPDVWNYMIATTKKFKDGPGIPIYQQLIDNGLDMSIVLEAGTCSATCPIYRTIPNRFNSALTQVPENVYYSGYWINSEYFNAYKDIFLRELAFRPIEDEKNKQYEREIQESLSVGIHIRRGDFLKINWQLPEIYYEAMINKIDHKLHNATYFVFSDEIDWCKENRNKLGLNKKRVVYIEGNYDYKNNYIDAKLMTMCKVLVVGASSFSYLASILNQTPNFYAIQVRNNPIDDIALQWLKQYGF